MRLFVFIAYCAGAAFAAVVSFALVDAVYTSQRVVGGVDVATELTRDDLARSESNVVLERHTIDLNEIEHLLTGNRHEHFKPLVWETNLGVYVTTRLILNFLVFAILALIAIFFIRLGTSNKKQSRLRRR